MYVNVPLYSYPVAAAEKEEADTRVEEPKSHMQAWGSVPFLIRTLVWNRMSRVNAIDSRSRQQGVTQSDHSPPSGLHAQSHTCEGRIDLW